mgnify:CR=1 FL=1|jgi:predicted nicotinamide N-methyase
MSHFTQPPSTYTQNAYRTIVVSNLGTKTSITLQQLNKLFSTIGDVDIVHRTPAKEVAHVVFAKRRLCHAALALNGTSIKPDSSADFVSIVIKLLVLDDDDNCKTDMTTTTTTTKKHGDDNNNDDDDDDGSDGSDYDTLDLGALLFDDPANCHGDPGKPFAYVWPVGAITSPPPSSLELHVPVPEEWDLMAHFVWESSIKMADLIVTGIIPVVGRHVLEVGAGAGLPSIVSARCGATHVIATDYPEPSVIEELRKNVVINVEDKKTIQVMGHSWGTDDCGDMSSHFPTPRIDVILAADTLWLHDQHKNLFQTLRECLTQTGSVAYFTYQHHNEHAPAFFELVEQYNHQKEGSTESSSTGEVDRRQYKVAHVSQHGWGGRELEDFDPEDEEIMGPIFLSTVTRIQ